MRSPVPVAGQWTLSFTVGTDGSIGDCAVQRRGEMAGAEVVPQQVPCDKRFKTPYAGANGKPVRRRVTITNTVVVDDEP